MSDSPSARNASDGENLERLLCRLDPDPTRAAQKYEDIRRVLIKFFQWNRSWRAEELADEVIARLSAKPIDDIQNVHAFARAVGRYVLLEESKKSWREASLDADGDVPAKDGSAVSNLEQEIVEGLDEKTRMGCMRQCRTKLPIADDAFVIAYYSAEGEKQKIHRNRLARTMGMTMNALRVHANRIRGKLEKCVTNCLEDRRKAFKRAYGGGQSDAS